jgi:hypothetical protein
MKRANLVLLAMTFAAFAPCLFALAPLARAVEAQNPGGNRSCLTQTSCSKARRACMTVGCRMEGRSNCAKGCDNLYAQCIQTGEWNGVHCQLKGLVRK